MLSNQHHTERYPLDAFKITICCRLKDDFFHNGPFGIFDIAFDKAAKSCHNAF